MSSSYRNPNRHIGNCMVGERTTELTTQRCVLRPITADDAEQLHELWSSPSEATPQTISAPPR